MKIVMKTKNDKKIYPTTFKNLKDIIKFFGKNECTEYRNYVILRGHPPIFYILNSKLEKVEDLI